MLTKRVAALSLAAAVLAGHPCAAAAQSCAYVANADDGTVSVINTMTRAVTLTIRVGLGPRGVAVAQRGAQAPLVFVVNRDDNALTIIDTASQTVVKRITVEAFPEQIAVTPQGTTAYVSHPDAGEVSVIDVASSAVTTMVHIGGTPRGIATAPDGSTVFVVDEAHDRVVVIDAATNSITGGFATGSGPVDIALAPDGALAYISSVPIAVLDSVTGEPDAVFGLRPMSAPHGIAISPNNSYALLCVADPSGGNVLSIGTDPITRIIPFPFTPLGEAAVPMAVAIAADSASAYVTDSAGDRVAVIDMPASTVTSIPVGTNPQGIAIAAVSNDCRLQPTPTATPAQCTGDCNGDRQVSINELILGVNIALDNVLLNACPAFDTSHDGVVGINELIEAVNAALAGCP